MLGRELGCHHSIRDVRQYEAILADSGAKSLMEFRQVENRRGQYGSSDEIPYQLWAVSFSFKATVLQAYVEAKSGPFSYQNGQPLL